MTASVQFDVQLNASPTPSDEREAILADPGFGKHFTDHMVVATWTPDRGWHDAVVKPYGPVQLDPATAVLHYAQEIFEGMKAYRHPDGSIQTFRPRSNAARFQRSAQRMALPELPVDTFLASLEELIKVDHDWVPSGAEQSLYLRPFMFASEVFLGVRPAQEVTFLLIASPAGAYFAQGVKPVSIWLSEEYTRAAVGGTGSAKCGGNYAASLLPQREAIENGCDQVVFLDPAERCWVEELGGMNLFFIYDDGTIVTPELGTILEGITRDSVITLAADLGLKVDERPIDIDEWRNGVSSGRIREVFACGTAAVITPVGMLKWRNGGELVMAENGAGPVTTQLRQTLLDIQYGHAEDQYGWMHRLG